MNQPSYIPSQQWCTLQCFHLSLKLVRHISYIQIYSLDTWPLSPLSDISPYISPNSACQDFAPALIMLRVALGQARQDAEWSGRTLSGIQFGNATPGVQESARTGGASSTILTAPRSHYGKEVHLEASTRREEGRDGVNEVKASI